MKRIIGHFKLVHKAAYLFMLASCLSFYSCEKYDDTKLWEEVNDLQERVYKLEEICKQTNTNIASIQSLLSAMEKNYSIVSIIPLEGDKGYTITFTNDKSITIYHGENGKDGIDGEDGKDGTDGKDGADGEDGKDGMTPQIGIKDMGDGNYCWTLNGEILKDAEGNPIRANGKDGADGEDGKDGEDGNNGTNGSNGSSAPIPQVKTGLQLSNAGINGNWNKTAVYLSVDGGTTWTKISSEGNNSIFASVDTSKDDCVVFTLADGTVITLPKTDKILNMLFGTWIRLNQRFDTVLDDKFIFNSDFTIQEIVGGSVYGYGPFKYYPDKQMIVVDYGYGNNEVTVFRIAEITDNMLYLIDDWQHRAYTLYKSIPLTLEKTELNVPKEGGTFTIGIQTDIDIYLDDEDSYNSFYESEVTSCCYALDNGQITVEVEPAAGIVMHPKIIGVFNKQGYCLATITIKQEGQPGTPVILDSEELMNAMSEISSLINYMTQLELAYTSLIPNDYFKAPLNTSNSTLNDCWSYSFNVINNLNQKINNLENEVQNSSLRTPLQVLKSIIYYKLITYWGNIPFTKDASVDVYNLTLSTPDEIFASLVIDLKLAIDELDEKDNAFSNNVSEAITLSKDIARMALAQIYMYQGKYQDAKPLLENIVTNSHYNLESSKTHYDEELILAIYYNHPTSIVYTYTDVILSLAECELHLDNQTKAKTYIQQVVEKKGISTTSDDLIIAMKDIYKDIVTSLWEYSRGYYGGYFAFLKRNGLAMSELGLESEHYLLFPIPQSEINMNPNIVQNPGY